MVMRLADGQFFENHDLPHIIKAEFFPVALVVVPCAKLFSVNAKGSL